MAGEELIDRQFALLPEHISFPPRRAGFSLRAEFVARSPVLPHLAIASNPTFQEKYFKYSELDLGDNSRISSGNFQSFCPKAYENTVKKNLNIGEDEITFAKRKTREAMG